MLTIPVLIIKLALIVIMIRSVYMLITFAKKPHKSWLEILYYISVTIVALYFYLVQFHSFL